MNCAWLYSGGSRLSSVFDTLSYPWKDRLQQITHVKKTKLKVICSSNPSGESFY